MSTLQAYHNNAAIKQKYIERVRAHRKADELVQGRTGPDKGCAVWCTLDAYDHSRYPIELGIPEWLAHLEDRMFEGLPVDKAQQWPEKFLQAIEPGTDLEQCKAPIMIGILEFALKQFDNERFADCTNAINRVIDLYRNGGTEDEFRVAARAAYTAVDAANAAARAAEVSYATRAAAYAADAAAYAAARAAVCATADVAANAADVAANAAAYAARAYVEISEIVLKVLESMSNQRGGS